MDEIINATGSTGATETEAPETNVSEGGGSSESPTNGSQPGGSNAPGNEGNEDSDPFVKGDDGKEYIPREAFEARINKLSAQKNDARTLLESIRTDPVIRQEFMDSLNLGEARTTSSTEPTEPTEFDNWLAPLQPEYQAHYKGLIGAIAPQFEKFVTDQLEKALAPVRSWIGESKVEGFSKANPDFSNYRNEISQIIQSGRAKTLEDAYKIVTFDKKMKSVMSANDKSESDRRNKLARSPVMGRGGNAIPTNGTKPKSLRNAIESAANQIGWSQ